MDRGSSREKDSWESDSDGTREKRVEERRGEKGEIKTERSEREIKSLNSRDLADFIQIQLAGLIGLSWNLEKSWVYHLRLKNKDDFSGCNRSLI